MPWVALFVLAICGVVGYIFAGWKGAVCAVVGFIAGKVF